MPDRLVEQVALAVELLPQLGADEEPQPIGPPLRFHLARGLVGAIDVGAASDVGSDAGPVEPTNSVGPGQERGFGRHDLRFQAIAMISLRYSYGGSPRSAADLYVVGGKGSALPHNNINGLDTSLPHFRKDFRIMISMTCEATSADFRSRFQSIEPTTLRPFCLLCASRISIERTSLSSHFSSMSRATLTGISNL
jgi:hypothetical protein